MMQILVLLFCLFVTPSLAWEPEGQVTIVLPFQIGGASGQTATLLKSEMAKRGLEATILPKPGAGSLTGHKFLADSPTDGRTIGIVTTAGLEAGEADSAAGYSRNSFATVAILGDQSFMLASNAATFTSMPRFLSHKGEIRVGTLTAAQEVGVAAVMGAAGRSVNELLRVPYKSGSQLFIDLAAGDIHITFGATPGVIAFANSGRVKLLAVSTRSRLSAFPTVPTVAESLPYFRFESQMLVALPAGAPKQAVDFYSKLLLQIMSHPGVSNFLYGSPLHMAKPK